MELIIRQIQKEDNLSIGKIIKDVLLEHNLNKAGTVYYDDILNCMYESHTVSGSIYFVALWDKNIIGGAGIYPTKGLPDDTCELVKMYLIPEARGKGIGKELLQKNLQFAKMQGYKKVYLETIEELKNAVSMYEKSGFNLLTAALANTGHFACTTRMIKNLEV